MDDGAIGKNKNKRQFALEEKKSKLAASVCDLIFLKKNVKNYCFVFLPIPISIFPSRKACHTIFMFLSCIILYIICLEKQRVK